MTTQPAIRHFWHPIRGASLRVNVRRSRVARPPATILDACGVVAETNPKNRRHYTAPETKPSFAIRRFYHPVRGAACSPACRGYRRFAPQPPATVCDAFGADSPSVNSPSADSPGVNFPSVDFPGVDSPSVNFPGAGAATNPKDCQKVAGGRSAAKTSGNDEQSASIPQGCQKPAARDDRHMP